ncbi:MAG TPA: GNAT family N-acetyltransferase [Acidimicrobiales bacterium]|nr:GNAT family N-acetyltransferase [Acidimicrobiales bacterium]
MTRPELVVQDAPGQERYEARAGDALAGISRYERAEPGGGGSGEPLFVFTHTEVDDAYEGQGVGGTLVRGALDDVRRRGAQVVPLCPFVRSWIERHPDYQDLVAAGG